MRSLITAFAVSMALGLTAQSTYAANPYSELKKELDVMVSVFETSLQPKNKRRSIYVRNIDATYLSGQGAVYSLSTSGSNNGLLIDLEGIADIADLVPSIEIMSSEGQMSIDFDEHWEHFAEESAHQLEDVFRQSADQIRELREQERDVAWERRELEREKRNLRFQMRNSGESDEDVKSALKEIDASLAALEKRELELREYAKELEKENQEKKQQRQQAKAKRYQQFLASFEADIGDTLCRFGAGLKALPKGENVTFVLRGITDNREDRIYVFEQQDIVKCVQGKTDAAKLLSSANVYEF